MRDIRGLKLKQMDKCYVNDPYATKLVDDKLSINTTIFYNKNHLKKEKIQKMKLKSMKDPDRDGIPNILDSQPKKRNKNKWKLY